MPLTTIKPMMAEAQALLASSKFTDTDENINFCAQGLDFLVKETDTYCKAISYSKKYVPHFTDELTGLVRLLESPPEPSAEGFSFFGEVHQRAFALVEDMALFVREKVLQNGAVVEHPFEKKLLSHFESSGNWVPANGEEITDTYYNRLPISVMNNMMKSQVEASA